MRHTGGRTCTIPANLQTVQSVFVRAIAASLAMRWIFVVRPPLDRPRAWLAGSPCRRHPPLAVGTGGHSNFRRCSRILSARPPWPGRQQILDGCVDAGGSRPERIAYQQRGDHLVGVPGPRRAHQDVLPPIHRPLCVIRRAGEPRNAFRGSERLRADSFVPPHQAAHLAVSREKAVESVPM